jgi:ATP-dependent DNA helicase RecG
MALIPSVKISEQEVNKILAINESHFTDLKAVEIKPAKLTRTLAAFANSEGGEIYIGISEDQTRLIRIWSGFASDEDANAHIAVFEELFPIGADSQMSFLSSDSKKGLVLKVEVPKSRSIKTASDGVVYVRRGAQNLPIDDATRLEILRRDKGIS